MMIKGMDELDIFKILNFFVKKIYGKSSKVVILSWMIVIFNLFMW